jgi:modulator of FtsH protease
MVLNLEKLDNVSNIGMERLKRTYMFVSLGILLATVGASILLSAGIKLGIISFVILIALEFGALFLFMYKKNVYTYSLFTFLTGLTLVPVLGSLLDAGNGYIILQALLSTFVITGLLTFYAGTTKNNFLKFSTILFYILIGVVVLAVINIFIGSSLFSLIISIITVVLFSFYIIMNTQEVLYTDIDPLDAAMNLYLDILNLFVSLLNILSYNKD